ncbi:MAG TPA: DUF3592 domain-containing protein [Gemmatales bacterium]|nr:DUF3592 domain-containing protein [Gemmatales bacterium]HMP60897.1 DUF3592 domain-containing protein [Gemmatales bacterium]
MANQSYAKISSFGSGRFMAIALLLFGVPALSVGLTLGFNMSQFLTVAKRTEGKVVALKHNNQSGTLRHRRSGSGLAPEVEYQVNGTRHRFLSHLSTSPPRYGVGDAVTVLYAPDQPEAGQIEGFLENWLIPLLASGLGGIFVLIGMAILIRSMRTRREDHPSLENAPA